MENQPPPQLHQYATPPPQSPNPNPEQQQQQQYCYPNPNPPPPQSPNPNPEQQQQQQQYCYPNPNPPPPQSPRPNPNAEQQQQYYYPNPSPEAAAAAAAAVGPYAPHGGYAVDTASVGAACYYDQGYGSDPVRHYEVDPNSHGQDSITPTPDKTTNSAEKDDEAKILEAAEPNKGMQLPYCAICDIYCNTDAVLNIHNVGRKHKNNLIKLQNSVTPKPDKAKSTTNSAENKEASVLEQEKALGLGQRKRVTEDDLETKKRKILGAGVDPREVKVCSICNVVVNSQIVYNSHVARSKHAAMVEKQKEGAMVEGETNVDPVMGE